LAWRDLPPGGVLGFFDVQPITVKAYGGRRYTAARRLVLDRRQKTRGRFYLFLLYDATTGRVRWQFRPGKGAVDVCAFMRRMRRWYPAPRVPAVWIVLDQDPAHPCRSGATRHQMRALGLHWISLPKASPDDNPAEAVFSDVQLMVLDHSNDPDAPTTQRRISAHLTRRNRRRDRFIRVRYLADRVCTKHR
jgi:hypothetical protein